MILLCGIRSDRPLARVAAALERLGQPVVFFDQRRFRSISLELDLSGPRVAGELALDEECVRLEDIRGVYTRLLDDRVLPELAGVPLGAEDRIACRRLHDDLGTWFELTDALVINRVGPMATNASKPFQAQFAQRAGFSVPETIVTNDPDAVREFAAGFSRVIYKSVSGVRSIVAELAADDLERLDDIRWCPVQFQERVAGVDLRVHVVGDEVFATRIGSTATDYRYAVRLGSPPAQLEAVAIDDELADRCVRLSESLGLYFSGIDLRLAYDGRVICFEANPSPAYSYYESHTGQPIAQAVARHLSALTGSYRDR